MGGLFHDESAAKAQRAAKRQIEEQRSENARLRTLAEEERRELAEKDEARRRARLRGGSRMLLSEARVAPEEGVMTLGSSEIERT